MFYRSSLGLIKINIFNGFINEVSFIKNGKAGVINGHK